MVSQAKKHSNKDKNFDNSIIVQYCKLLGIEKSTAMPTYRNSLCEKFNTTLQDLFKTLPKGLKPNWPTHIDTLVFAYNAMPHPIAEYQPYQLMFG